MPKSEIKKLKDEINRLRKLIIKDELTGVLNRRGIKEKFETLFKETLYLQGKHKSKRKIEIENISVIFIDIDDFKKINDAFGHAAGDKVLKVAVEVFKKKIRGIDLLGRIGGEEFVVVLAGATENEAYEKAEEIRKHIQKRCLIPKNKNLKITLSIGVASLKKSKAKDVMGLISMADKAMYEAKTNRGKNNTVKHSEIG